MTPQRDRGLRSAWVLEPMSILKMDQIFPACELRYKMSSAFLGIKMQKSMSLVLLINLLFVKNTKYRTHRTDLFGVHNLLQSSLGMDKLSLHI